MGQSAGSWSVIHQLLNPKLNGVFARAIAQSGSIVGGLALNSRSVEAGAKQGLDFAEKFGCSNLTCMQSIDVKDLFMKFVYLPRGSVDGGLSEDPVLPRDPEESFRTGQFNQVPLLIGATNGEGILIGEIIGLIELQYYVMNLIWPVLGPWTIFEKNPGEHEMAMAKEVRKHYMKPFGLFGCYNEQGLVTMYTDAMFL